MRIPAGLLACCLVLTGCVLSIDAVVPATETTFDPRLLGEWQGGSSGERAVIARDSGGAYAIEYTDEKGKRGSFKARLGHLGPRLVLDIWPAPDDATVQGPAADALIPGHVLVSLEIGSDSLVARSLDPDSLDAALRSRAVRLTSSTVGDQLILHGTTAQLRAALVPWAARPGAWHEPDTWRRPSRASLARPVDPPCFEAAPWREADRLFHRDPHWVGSDVASSVDLGGGRVLWLFGDSWVDTTGRRTRRGARMVSNTVAVQTGLDPTTASIRFYWGHGADGRPAAFVPDRGPEHLWFGHGVRVDDRLVLFLARTRATPDVGGWENLGWTAVLVENPDAEPSAWRVTPLATPPSPFGVLLGFTAVAQSGGWVYGIGSSMVANHPSYAARWSTADVRAGNLLHPEWWAGENHGWVPDSSPVTRRPIFEYGAPEETIHFDSISGRYLAFQIVGFPVADVHLRAAPEITGPWSGTRMLYRPPEYYRPGAAIYSAKAHPELSGADLAVTYATNTAEFADQIADTLIYYPRFVRLTRCR